MPRDCLKASAKHCPKGALRARASWTSTLPRGREALLYGKQRRAILLSTAPAPQGSNHSKQPHQAQHANRKRPFYTHSLSPWPSWPYLLHPYVYSCPASDTAMLCLQPHATWAGAVRRAARLSAVPHSRPKQVSTQTTSGMALSHSLTLLL
jgi:hypothetical protein